MSLTWLDADTISFPPVESALTRPNGLLAAGGGLDPDWLLHAYRQGIFPWYEAGQPILWWSPDPRMVLLPGSLRLSRSLKKFLNKHSYNVSFDSDFKAVIRGCAASGQRGTQAEGAWLTAEMQAAYTALHERGYAHSVEVWDGVSLVGGLYGVALGRVFFGESMFSKASNASKLALVCLARQLARWGFELIDCQVSSEHLLSLGAGEIPRTEFLRRLEQLLPHPAEAGKWSLDPALAAPGHEY